ncbi:DUF4169 family protein [uncultured Roseovarius sp.]|uniref:DUF4169 family protein n=1 Tax=uncultured Roseovarius sp. TaxID=293344 RepID=UPI000C35C0FB|nr:DUF4169 domain-containing protein [Roseovarius sp.]MBD11482.1 DUF4169 domain-containing protein [Roseovarius sp.]|tara:strand:+ start:2826 stop:3008 length:183 start_codon:yes stop_codon:yes gene_type:complete
MTEGPVNLNRVRKQKARAEEKARANENAARFGRTKAQKALEQAQADKARAVLDQHRRDED